jgi:molybdopterin molybdotransferase
MSALPSYHEALSRILAEVVALPAESVVLSEALGRVLAEDIRADRDQPPFDRSAMDGYAVRSSQVKAGMTYRVAGEAPAGGARAIFETAMPDGAVMQIGTGAPLPPGADAVIPVEQTNAKGGESPAEITFSFDTLKPWQNVHRRASDASRGGVVIAAGTRLLPQHVGIAASVGCATVRMRCAPRIALLTTGDEVRPFNTTTADLEPQQIRNSNGPLLAAMLHAIGAPLRSHEHIVDDPEVTRAAAREALAASHLVLTCGGVSVGQRDFLPITWQRLGLTTVLHGVAIQPGKPVFVATPEGEGDDKLVIGLPGNPVSTLACAHLFVWPVLRKMLGQLPVELPWRSVALSNEAKPNANRQVFRAARLLGDGRAEIIHWHGSGDLVHTASADGFVRLPVQSEPLKAGDVVPYLPMVGGL